MSPACKPMISSEAKCPNYANKLALLELVVSKLCPRQKLFIGELINKIKKINEKKTEKKKHTLLRLLLMSRKQPNKTITAHLLNYLLYHMTKIKTFDQVLHHKPPTSTNL